MRVGGRMPEVCCLALVAVAALTASGCHHRDEVADLPPVATAPPIYRPAPRQHQTLPPAPSVLPPARIAPTPVPPGGVTAEDMDSKFEGQPVVATLEGGRIKIRVLN